jgi:hypothetical protein
MKKYILLEIEVPEYCNDCGGANDAHLTSKQFSFDEMLKDLDFRDQLIKQGWADTGIGHGLQADSLGPRIALLSHYAGNGYVTGTLADPSSAGTMYQLMNQPNLFLAIELGEEALKVINPEGHKQYKAVIEQRKKYLAAQVETAKKKKEAAAAKKVKTEAKKIEDAKKLLLKVGVKVGE